MKTLLSTLAIALVAGSMRGDVVPADKYAGYQELVAETHKNSLIARENSYRLTAKHSSGLGGVWGANNWSLSQLLANENLEDVNARLRTTAETYLSEYAIYAPKRAALDAQKLAEENAPGYVEPTTRAGLKARRVKYRLALPQYPWQYFDIADYVRMIHMFGADSTFFPGRLTPETETVMKEALWNKHKIEVLSNHSPTHTINLRGTENHDLTKAVNIYLMAELFAKDPKFKDRKYADGSSVSEMLKVVTAYEQEWPRKRAMTGIWIELGSSNYQKYSWPALFNMADLALDPIVKKRFNMLLDLAFIEEAQVSFLGSRGGGGSRGTSCRTKFQCYKNLFYAPQGSSDLVFDGYRGASRASHTKVLEASRYQLPAAAILLRKREFPVAEPFLIQNRFLGEIVPPTPEKPSSSQFKDDGALVNYTWRTPYSLLGGVHWDPRLMYGSISSNKRFGSMIFNERNEILRLPLRHTTFISWENVIGYQDKNVMLLQRYAYPYSLLFQDSHIQKSDDKKGYSLGKGPLEKNTVEKNGWIFTGNGKAFVAIKFLDHSYFWERRPVSKGSEDTNWFWAHNEDKNEAKKKCSDKDCSCRVLLISGDIDTDNSFEAFVEKVLSQKLTVTADVVKYQADEKSPMLEFFRYDFLTKGKSFELPKIDGKTLNLKPEMTYQSPYLNAKSGEDRITVTVGPIKQVYDFGKSTVTTISE